jgi:HAD superfamily hydrolase (TIGR01450 family)
MMNQLPFTIVLLIVVSASFLGTTDSLSAPSSSFSTSSPNANSNNNLTDQMHQAATAEAEKLFQFYNPSSTTILRPPVVWQSSEEASTYVKEHIDTVLFDCDGVLYRTQSQCPGASECIQNLMHRDGKRVLFVTNNAGVNRRELRDKLSKLLGIDSLTTNQMISSSYSSARYLQRELLGPETTNTENLQSKHRKRVHVIGSSGLCEELVAAGFEVTGGPNTTTEAGSMSRDELSSYDFETSFSSIDALVVGHDTDLNFRKLCIADNLLLRNPKALFVATNLDSFDVVDGNEQDPRTRHILGNGATVVALEYSSKRKAINVGKPSQELFDLIQQADGDESLVESSNQPQEPQPEEPNTPPSGLGDPSRCLFVGDRLDTDIRFGRDNGMKSLLVMTGVTSAQTLQDLENGTEEEPLPDFVLPHVGMLV